ncbi:hypothetical protein BDW22DRAFT_344311 [Trametopsis cervina]|nr:hypothetical protein BDW22DRAFT_344311 [Trametopsis cervina]
MQHRGVCSGEWKGVSCRVIRLSIPSIYPYAPSVSTRAGVEFSEHFAIADAISACLTSSVIISEHHLAILQSLSVDRSMMVGPKLVWMLVWMHSGKLAYQGWNSSLSEWQCLNCLSRLEALFSSFECVPLPLFPFCFLSAALDVGRTIQNIGEAWCWWFSSSRTLFCAVDSIALLSSAVTQQAAATPLYHSVKSCTLLRSFNMLINTPCLCFSQVALPSHHSSLHTHVSVHKTPLVPGLLFTPGSKHKQCKTPSYSILPPSLRSLCTVCTQTKVCIACPILTLLRRGHDHPRHSPLKLRHFSQRCMPSPHAFRILRCHPLSLEAS